MAPTLVYTFGFTALAVSTLNWLGGYRRALQAPLNGFLTAVVLWCLLCVMAFLGLTPEANFGLQGPTPINSEAVAFLTKTVVCTFAALLAGLGAWGGSWLGSSLKSSFSVAICACLGTVLTGLGAVWLLARF